MNARTEANRVRRWPGFADKHFPILFGVPALAFVVALFLYPLLRLFWQSLATIDGEFTLQGYVEVATSPLFRKVLWTTLEISATATVVTLLVAYPIAYHLARQTPRQRAFLLVLVLLPFWTSILVKSFAFTVVLGDQGLLNRMLSTLFGSAAMLKLLFNRTGVIIGLTHTFIPFMLFPILNSLLAQDPSLRKAAEVMGAGPLRIFLRITFPLSLPGVTAGCFLTFILSLGFFITPALLGGRQDVMLANLVDFFTRETLNWTLASAVSVVLLTVSVVLMLIMSRLPGGDAILGETTE